MRMNARVVALGAGVFFVSLAIFVQGLLPFLHPESRTTEVTQVVRTDLGELGGCADGTDYTSSRAMGAIYIREVAGTPRSSSARSRARRGAGAR